MSTIPAKKKTEVTILLDEASLQGIELKEEAAAKLLKKVGDRGLCIDALQMKVRPEWLVEIAGE